MMNTSESEFVEKVIILYNVQKKKKKEVFCFLFCVLQLMDW